MTAPLCCEWNSIWKEMVSVSGKLLLTFASTGILGSGPLGTPDHIFLCHDSDRVARLTRRGGGGGGEIYVAQLFKYTYKK
jgi:hypothetical protein